MKNFLFLVGFIFICQMAGIVGSVFTIDSIPTWYASLNKPFFNPPNWIFGPVWLSLYTLMGVSLYLVWKKGLKTKQVKLGFWLFFAHLVVNSAWSIIFFGFQNTSIAFVVILILWTMIVWLIYLFYRIDKTAAYMLFPYFSWVSFATILNYSIMLLN